MTWLPLSLLALIFFSLYELYSRVAGVRSKNPRVFSVIYNAIAAILAVPFIFLTPLPGLQFTDKIILLLILDLIIWAAFGRLEYYTHKEVEASTLSIVLKLAPVITFILGSIFLQEIITPNKIIGLSVLVLANVILLVGNKQQLISLKGIKYAIGLSVLMGIAWTVDKLVSPYFGVFAFSAIAFFSPALINGVTPLVKKKEITQELTHTNLKQIIIMAAFNLLGYFCFIQALILGEASKVTPIATATTPLVMILGIIFLKEKGHLGKKIFSCLLIILGIWLLR